MAEEKLKDLKSLDSGASFTTFVPKDLRMTVLAVPCSPIRSTALFCLCIVSTKKFILTLSTFGTRIEEYSGQWSVGYSYLSTRSSQCCQLPG